VPFALTGGVYLLWLLGYNFSVAVWVGFIALFGTAVQTGIVMVIYLEEAVRQKTAEVGGVLTRRDLREAVIDGALLRLRPKVMTVSTVIAGLLPIMWSDRVGAEVMKPLATPVLGGMVSSLLHVLVVTPVLFYWIHEKRVTYAAGPSEDVGRVPLSEETGGPAAWKVVAVLVLIAALTGGWWIWNRDTPGAPTGAVLQTVRSGNLVITLSNPDGQLELGATSFRIEFRSSDTNELVDVGTVQLAAAMAMPGMAMSGGVTVMPTGEPGVYEATGNFGMAGAWQMTIEWNGPAGRGSAAFEGNVQ
jgi:Cu(I)/Ag(I) efflux system membrane protein CusA/SilA